MEASIPWLHHEDVLDIEFAASVVTKNPRRTKKLEVYFVRCAYTMIWLFKFMLCTSYVSLILFH